MWQHTYCILLNLKYYYIIKFVNFLNILYNSLQTFAIPGSIFLSILLGFLYKFHIAIILICFSSAVGATLCSYFVGKPLILHFFHNRITNIVKYVNIYKDSLFYLMIFLRITPILPDWLINLCAPIVGKPLPTFVFGTFIVVVHYSSTLQPGNRWRFWNLLLTYTHFYFSEFQEKRNFGHFVAVNDKNFRWVILVRGYICSKLKENFKTSITLKLIYQ